MSTSIMSALELITSAPASELVAGAGQQPAVGKDREREDELKPVRRKRIITKAREEQNRRAQRVFSENILHVYLKISCD